MNKRKLIYILSPSYSGSTLLTMLMARHPMVATIGELKATSMGDLSTYTCSCGSLIKQCAFWSELEKRLEQDKYELDLNDFQTHFVSRLKTANKIMSAQVRGPLFEFIRKILIQNLAAVRKEYLRILDKNKKMIETICEIQNKHVFLDGSKDPQRLLYFYRSGIWDIKIIKMYRDGRAQCNSNREKEQSNMNYVQSALEWKSTIKQMHRVLSEIPEEKIHSVKYEELATQPNHVMNNLWRFLQLDPIEYDWTEVDIRDFEHHILGNSMRTKERIYISLDEGWKTKVKEAELREFESIASKINSSLGYK